MLAFKKFLFENMLLEDKIDFILNKQGDKVWSAYEKDKGGGKPKVKNADDVIKILADWSTKNLQWLVNSYIKGQFSLEDKGRIVKAIDLFNKLKPKLSVKDPNQYKSIEEMESELDKFTEQDTKSNKQLAREEEQRYFKDGEAKLFYNKGGVKIIIPKTEEASCHFGIGTKWCTAGEKNNMFKNYSSKGQLYIVFTDDGRKYQFFFRRGQQQFADEKDHMLSDQEMYELIKKYPAIQDAFKTKAKSSGYLPLIKDPKDEDYLNVAKNNPNQVIQLFKNDKKVIPEKISDYILSKNPSVISRYPQVFGKQTALNHLEKYNDYLVIIAWLKQIKEHDIDLKKEEFLKLIDNILVKGKNRYNTIHLISYILTEKLQPYEQWLMSLPLEKKIELIGYDDEMIKYFEDDLTEKYKIELIDKDPDILKKFKHPTNKMTQQAKWVEDRIKRKNRGF